MLQAMTFKPRDSFTGAFPAIMSAHYVTEKLRGAEARLGERWAIVTEECKSLSCTERS